MKPALGISALLPCLLVGFDARGAEEHAKKSLLDGVVDPPGAKPSPAAPPG